MTVSIDEAYILSALEALRRGEARAAREVRREIELRSLEAQARAWKAAIDGHLLAAGLGAEQGALDEIEALMEHSPLPAAIAAHHAFRASVLGFDHETAERALGIELRAVPHLGEDLGLRAEVDAAWFGLLEGRHDLQALQNLERRALLADVADVVVDSASLRALCLAESGELDDAREQARRASRMARTEALPQQEYFANVVLSRVRRLAGHAFLATRILSALARFASAPWSDWIAWELTLAAGLGVPEELILEQSPAHGLRTILESALHAQPRELERWYDWSKLRVRGVQFAQSDLMRVRAALDCDFELASEDGRLSEWRRGALDDPPFGLLGLASEVSSELPHAYVVVGPTRPPRRVLRLGNELLIPCDLHLAPPQRREGRTDAVIAALGLAGTEGDTEAGLFARVWGFPYAPERHQDVLNMALSRARARVSGAAEITREGGRLRLTPRVVLAVSDPRGSTHAEDRVLSFLARKGHASATRAAEDLGVPLRSVQASLKLLVDEGLCRQDRRGRSIEYSVEDTTFQEPTRSGS